MPVQTVSISPFSQFLAHSHIRRSPSSKRLYAPRLKTVASALFRHGYLCPSTQQTTESKPHNMDVSACKLPEEVIHKIFIACAQLGPNPCETWSWVTLSYVCSKWRRAALNCTDLWRHVDFSHPKWYSITLGRAKMTPLHVRATVTDQNIRQLHRTLQLAHRIEDIHLTSPLHRILPLLEILAHPNPALESLIVDIQVPEDQMHLNVYDPPSFPTGGPPLRNLKYMELRGAPFYLLTSRCTFLTHLRLYDLPLAERPTLRYFLFVLEQLTHLEFLTLDQAFPINMDVDDVQALEKRTPLQHLQALSLVGSIAELANILECIDIPPAARLTCRISALSDLNSHIWKFAQAINDISWADAAFAPLETLVLTGNESSSRYTEDFQLNPDFHQSLRLRAFRSGCDQDGAYFDLSISPDGVCPSDSALVIIFSAVLKSFALSKVHTLALQDLDIVTQKSWLNILRALPSLRVLDITGRAPSGLAWAMLLNARSQAQTIQEDVGQCLLIPRLDDIYLHKVDCSSGGFMVATHSQVNSHNDLDDSRFLDVLNASLAARQRLGTCLRSLSISRCDYVPKLAVEEAKKVVSHLICDLRNIRKEEEVDEACPARYWGGKSLEGFPARHYHRLRTLIQLDAEA